MQATREQILERGQALVARSHGVASVDAADLAALTAAAASWTGDVLARLRRLGRPRPFAAELQRVTTVVAFAHAYFSDLAALTADPDAAPTAAPRLASRMQLILDWLGTIDPRPVEDAVRRYYDGAFAKVHDDAGYEAEVVDAYEARAEGLRLDDALAEHR